MLCRVTVPLSIVSLTLPRLLSLSLSLPPSLSVCLSVCLSVYLSVCRRPTYRAKGSGATLVETNDLFFSLHALVLCIVTAVQCYVYTRKEDAGRWSVVGKVAVFVAILAATTALTPSAEHVVVCSLCGKGNGSAGGGSRDLGASKSTTDFRWVRFLEILSAIKVAVSFAKYVPQVYLNYSRQSTRGWSIANVLLDFTGGALSVSQMALDAVSSGSGTALTFLTSPKLFLGLLSLVFDVIFIVQHYVLYAENYVGGEGETRALLASAGQQQQQKREREQQKQEELENGQGGSAMERGTQDYGSAAACCEETVVDGFGSRGEAWE